MAIGPPGWHRARVTSRQRELGLVLSTWLLLAIVMAFLASQNLSVPGLYYDEAVFEGLAKDFVTGEQSANRRHMPGTQVIKLGGRPFPVFVVPYIGALKSWMLIPSFGVFGATPTVARATNFWAMMLALLIFMLGIWRWLGIPTSLVSATILATDPNYFFLSILDWGAVVPSLICKAAALYFLIAWTQQRRTSQLLLGAFLIGLGVFNKVDLSVPAIAAAIAAFVCYRGPILAAVSARPTILGAPILGFLLGAGPMLFKIGWFWGLERSGHMSSFGWELPEKLQTMISMYDGAYFYRLMEAGGMFARMFQGPTNGACVASLALVVGSFSCLVWIFLSDTGDKARVALLILLCVFLTTAGVFLLPDAVRIHHAVLVFPLPQLALGFAAMWLWNKQSTPQIQFTLRSITVISLLLFGAVHVWNIVRTQELIRQTGGRGLWSDSLNAFCREYTHRSDLTFVSLDWGFNEQLAFLTNAPRLSEPVWALGGEIPRDTPLTRDPGVIYLLHPPLYTIAPESIRYLEATRSDANAEITPYLDRQGQIAFYAIRFPPH